MAGALVLGYTLYRNVWPYPTGTGAWLPIWAGGWALVAIVAVIVAPKAARRLGVMLTEADGLKPAGTGRGPRRRGRARTRGAGDNGLLSRPATLFLRSPPSRSSAASAMSSAMFRHDAEMTELVLEFCRLVASALIRFRSTSGARGARRLMCSTACSVKRATTLRSSCSSSAISSRAPSS